MRLLLMPFLIFIGCAPALYVPSAENTAPGKDLAALREGRKLYTAHCGSCHTLHLPEEYSEAFWKNQLEEMQAKAKISDTEKQLIYEFLTNQPRKE